ncbi:DEKNAAC104195 [Brettanomyces naardenensis]|uniref:ferric-chelate reductase (NADPH) n=1 Tax=Brettanomyces naardenensis TaxID=13370 RepID=A0A448YQ03_BRENA|nr:DEKNAAC104195 [Brettanomyces naardenensis]
MFSLLPLFLFGGSVLATSEWKTVKNYNTGSSQFWACDSVVTTALTYDYVPLGEGEYSAYYDAMCGYSPCVGSMMLCCNQLSDSDSHKMDQVYHIAAQTCSEYSSYQYDWTYYRDQFENATKNFLDPSDIKNISLPIYAPTYANMTLAEETYVAYNAFYKNLDDATYYGIGVFVYFAVLFVIASVFNLLTRIGVVQKFCNPFVNKLRSYLTIPSLCPKGKNAQPVGWKYFSSMLPNRQESLVGLGLTIMQIVFYCIPYHQNELPALFVTAQKGWTRLIADRAGIMAFGKVPLVILLAGRNNLLCFCTGIKYSSFIQYHKMVARWLFVDALIHGVGYTITEQGEYTLDLEDLYFVCGITALVIVGVMLLCSMNVFRRHTYEIFLYTHIILAVALIVMCWYHCNTLGWCEWIIAASAVWFTDRLVRVIRMSTFGFRNSQIEMMSNETFKVTVDKPSHFHSTPGQFGYVYFSDSLLFFQNHPFTLVSGKDHVTLYIKAKRGITAKIMRQLKANGGKLTKRVCIEGPYGESSPIQRYDNTLLIAGGAGIPGMADYAIQFAESKTNIKFIWFQRKVGEPEIYIRDFLPKLKDTNVDIDMYLTQEGKQHSEEIYEAISQYADGFGSDDAGSSSSASDKNEVSEHSEKIKVKYGRPDMKSLVREEMSDIEGSVAIVSCGPAKMEDDLNAAVAEEVERSKSRIDLFDEMQIW